MSRLQMYREYLANLEAQTDPRQSIDRGFYVGRPKSIAEQVAMRVELAPSSSHLVLGAIGSGKTTELLIAEKRLKSVDDTATFYVDVSKHHDLSEMQSGVLVALAGSFLVDLVHKHLSSIPKPLALHIRALRSYAHGETIMRYPPDDDGFDPDYEDYANEGYPEFRPGKIKPPIQSLDSDIEARQANLAAVRAALTEKIPHIVILFDSLDRIANQQLFHDIIDQDVRALKAAGIGLVVVGPLRLLYGKERSITDRFDHYYHQATVDIQKEDGRRFLRKIIRTRAPSRHPLTAQACKRIIEVSGGVLRDLIKLAKDSGEEAYSRGLNNITKESVDSSADSFGRNLLLGVGSKGIETLQRVRTKKNFIATDDNELQLLITRRVLEYVNGRTRYAVHPTIEPLLEQIGKEK